MITDAAGDDHIYITGTSLGNHTMARYGNDLSLGFEDGSSLRISNAILGSTVETVIFADQSLILSIGTLCQEYYTYWD